MRIGVLTVSDRVSKGEMEDGGGGAVVDQLAEVVPDADIVRALVADDRSAISDILRQWSDELDLDAILTTGGTGLGPRDTTPEATLDVIGWRVPGIEETIRAQGVAKLPTAMLSRGVAGVRSQTLIVNLPGNPHGAAHGAHIVTSVLKHAVDLLHGRTRHAEPDRT